MQRLLDLLLSGFALLFLSPMLIPISIVLKFSGEGEIFFLQDRIGRDGKKFSLYKFATMLKDSPNIGNGTVTLRDDPRVLPVGIYLRKTKINELPQLINIFKGDMSIIGPRPQARRSFDAFSEAAQKDILRVRPGLSGIGSIIFRNEENMIDSNNDPNKFYDELVMPYKGKLEQWYVANRNIKTYFILIFMTIFVLLSSSSSLVWKVLRDLPSPPKDLEPWI
tara:strand:- start:2048 stop:2713 length:666 start_codon:yes stop_codon:yes gene_type:complete